MTTHLLFKEAKEALELKVLNKRKRLDALKHATQTQQRRLEELQLTYERLKKAAGTRARHCDPRARKQEEDAMVVLTVQRCVLQYWLIFVNSLAARFVLFVTTENALAGKQPGEDALQVQRGREHHCELSETQKSLAGEHSTHFLHKYKTLSVLKYKTLSVLLSGSGSQEESLTYQGQLDGLEAELLKYRAELNNMQGINSNALQSKEDAKVGQSDV